LCCFNKFVDHGGRRGDRAQALALWQYPVASSEALDVLYWTMRPMLYHCIAMATEIATFTYFFPNQGWRDSTTI